MKKWNEISPFTGSSIGEDAPTNSAGSGSIAGLGVGPMGEPGVDPKKKKKYLASLFTSKGCVAACTFCQREAGGYRVFDLEEFDKHLEFIK